MSFHRYSTEQIIDKSFRNCHAPGVDSLVLGEGDSGELVRVFWARKGHSLGVRHPLSQELQIAFHGHHCDIEIHMLHGCMINSVASRTFGDGIGHIKAWQFQSKIARPDNGAGFIRQPEHDMLDGFVNTILTADKSCQAHYTYMHADDRHTVFVPDEEAFWLIREHPTEYGRETPKVVYSNNDLSKFSFNGLYQPFTNTEEIAYVLSIAGKWL